MAGELRLFIENRPIRSRPIPFYQQFWRWCQRNPGLAGANIAAAVLTSILAIVSTFAAWTYREQRNAIGDNLIKIKASEAEAVGPGLKRARSFSRRSAPGPRRTAQPQCRSAVRQLGCPATGSHNRPGAEASSGAIRVAPRRSDRLHGPARPQAHRPGHHSASGCDQGRLRSHDDPLRAGVP